MGFFIFLIFFFSHRYILYQEPHFLTFDELRAFAQNPNPGRRLKKKLEKFWRTPIISNRAYYHGARPHRPTDPKLGRYLRLVSWNIEKSYEMENAIKAFTSEEQFRALIDPGKVSEGSPEYLDILRQRKKLSNTDIVVLQEMDIGHKRSGYINAAEELAKKLNMNYTFAPEQLEIDPIYLGLGKILHTDGKADQEATDYYAADPHRYKGVFGCAVLSRYPIKKVTAFQLKHQAYDWYQGEKAKTGFLEKSRRTGSEIVFKNEITRELKLGGRIFFRVDLNVPGLPENTLTIINIHLEIKCQPEGRLAQMSEILFSYIHSIKHPVIVVGDFNAAPQDLSPTRMMRVAERTAKSPETWFSVAVNYLSPYGLIVNTSRWTGKWASNLQDPLAPDVAVIFPNPLKPLFTMIQNYRFDDGGAFDFRGDKNRSIDSKDKTLSNSNQRDLKGFKTTFSVKRPMAMVIGKYRLDWVFVKSYLKNPFDVKGPYRFAPHFGETLEEMNLSLKKPISDHHPNVVDLPFKEPKT